MIMEHVIIQLASYTEQAFQFAWLPLLIWTIVSIPVWMMLRSAGNIHPQYHYHGRLALIFALPAGLMILTLMQGAGSWLFPEAPAETMKIVTFISPIEIGVTPSESASVLSLAETGYAAAALLFATGILFLMGRFFMQWLQLHRLKRTLPFTAIFDACDLDPVNRQLAGSHSRPIRVAFLKEAIVPVTFGFRKPVILLPETLRHDEEKCNLAIRHELTHILQKDFITHASVLITQMLFWFHPLVHRLKKELVDYREMRCDSMVLSGENVSRKKYASLLLELLPMPVINKELSVNMAQESSNLKKRIQMITQQNLNKPIPKRSSLAIFGTIILCTAIAMACTDMQTQQVFDNEELNLMTDLDYGGERGYHQIIIYMGDEEQAERYQHLLSQLNELTPEPIEVVEVLESENAVERFGQRAESGVIRIQTRRDADAFNSVLRILGMEEMDIVNPPPPPAHPDFDEENYFVVVEEMPELIGGLASIQQEIRYPEMARRAGIEGRVYVQFIVNEEGDVEDARVIRGIGGGADEEALRVVEMAKFEPGMQRGRPVRVLYSLPIFFRLPEGEGSETIQPESSVIMENPEVMEQSMTVQLDRSGNQVSGTILDAESGQPLAGANIFIEGSNTGTSTDIDGNFVITGVQDDASSISISYVGYGRAEVAL
jgi:TonB family protein